MSPFIPIFKALCAAAIYTEGPSRPLRLGRAVGGWWVFSIRIARLAFSRPNMANLAFFLNVWPRNF